MNIAFDAKRIMRNATGLGNYSRYAAAVLADAAPEHSYWLYADAGTERARALLERSNVCLRTPDTVLGRMVPSLWRRRGISAQLVRDGVDLYHGLSNEIPSGMRVPSVVTIHDLIWRRVPSDYKAADRRLYDMKYGSSAREAGHVIAISQCTKRDLMSDWNIAPERISVVYQGIDPQFKPVSDAAAVAARYGLEGRYIIGVGTIQSRKNQLLAVEALRALPADVKLALVGSLTPYAQDIRRYAAQHGLDDRLVWLQGVPFQDLPALYSAATVASYPSRYEGFGLPVVEAIACGTPVVAATGSCLEEAGGPGALYVDPDDAEAFAHAARLFLDDSALRARTVSAGQEYIRRFSPQNFAQGTLAAYQKAIQNF